mgnify:CR=1 FL=1
MTVQLLCCSKHQRGWSSVSNFKTWQSLWVLNFWISKKDMDEWNVFSKKITFERNALFSFQNFVVEWFDGQVFMQLLTSFLGAINLACYIFNVWNRCAFAPVRYQRSDCRFTHCDTDANYIFNLYFTNNYNFVFCMRVLRSQYILN